MVTTKWRQEAAQMDGLVAKILKEIKEIEIASADQLITVSDSAVDFVVIQALGDPDNVAQIKVLEGTRRSNYSGLSNDNS